MQDILINWAPQETRVAVVENGAVQELHIERALERGLVGNIYTGRVARVLPGMQSAFVDIGLERAAFLHVADVHVAGAPHAQRRAADADRAAGVRGPDADGAGHQGRHRHQGRAAVHADQHRRAAARLPAAGRPHRHLAEDRLARAARAVARAHEPCSPRCPKAPGRPAASSCAPTRKRPPTRNSPTTSRYLRKTWAAVRERGFSSPPGTLLHQDLSLVERVLRDLVHDATGAIRIDSKMQFDILKAFGQEYTPDRGGQARALQGRTADLRPVQHRRRGRQGAGAACRPEERRLPDHRPDRGADDDRREHRRLRRRAQLRRHHLQDQPRGGAGHRAPAAAAQPRRHHHHRLHRHGARGAPERRARPSCASSSRATAPRSRSAASRSSAWWR